MLVDGPASASETEESTIHRVGCGRGLGPLGEVVAGGQGERADGDSGLGAG